MLSCSLIEILWEKLRVRRGVDSTHRRVVDRNVKRTNEEDTPIAKTEVSSKKSEGWFGNNIWTSTVCTSPFWLPCDGPNTEICKVWNVGGMFDFENSNEQGWNGGHWPPK